MKPARHCVRELAPRVAFVVTVLAQVAVLNQYLTRYEAKTSFHAFLLLYAPALALWARGQCHRDRHRVVAAGVWVLYLMPLSVETGWILGRHGSNIDQSSLLNAGFLKYVLSLAAVVFLILESQGIDLRLDSSRSWLHVVDVLDAVDLLGVLFSVDQAPPLPSSVRIAIVASTLICLFSMTFSLTESLKSLGQNSDFTPELPTAILIHLLVQALLVNFPFLVIRLVLHYSYKQGSSVFAFKNSLMILQDVSAVCCNTCCCSAACPGEAAHTATAVNGGRSAQPSAGDTDESLSTVSSGRRPTEKPRRIDRRLIQATDIELIEADVV